MHLTVAQRQPHLIRLLVILGLFSISQAAGFWNSSLYSYEANTGWNWAANFISDLGRTSWYNGMPAPLEQRLWFLLGMTSLGLAVATWFSRSSLVGQLLGWIAGTSFLGVALLPADIVRWPHRIALLAGLIFTMLAAFNNWKASLTNRLLATFLLAYLAFLFTFPLPETSNEAALVHSVAQKAAVLGTLALLVLGSSRAWKLRG